MKPILLFDLDNTLLNNDINIFLGGYLKALGKQLAPVVSSEKMVRELLAATDKMTSKDMPEQTLEETFDRFFYPAIGVQKSDLAGTLQLFYEQVFPTLEYLTNPSPDAIRLVNTLFDQGYQIVVATNPLFPRLAILHRLKWANLPIEKYPFSLVTSYESLHFTKPNPAYFAEILAQLGWHDQPAVMIGDSLNLDIIPASQLGMPGFLLTDQQEIFPTGLHPLYAQGKIGDVMSWIHKVEDADIKIKTDSPSACLAILKSTPAGLATLQKQFSDGLWNSRPNPEEWSLVEIMAHLRDVDLEVNRPRCEKICKEEDPFLPGIDTDCWAEERNYILSSGPQVFNQFESGRTGLLNLLVNLPDESWQKPARHAIFGPTNLNELVSFIAIHDQVHVRQSYKVIRAAKKINPFLHAF
jgi:FMN phosphatase YigB (HAD superfamily)